MTTEQILQECKEVYATNYGFKSYADFQHRLSIGGSNANDFQDVIELLATQLYAQKIAELFAEWTCENYLMVHSKTSHAWVNYKENIIYTHGSDTHYLHLIANKGKTTSELYTEFLNQLNKQK